ncbi:MAG TPA: hypothetical protein DCP63_00090 [Bacteroidetes bacterium]|nr:hypothetical protein [Bacteroidota bacterium]
MSRTHWLWLIALVVHSTGIAPLEAQEEGLPDSLYYIGVGVERNLDNARSSALNALSQEIQVLISSSFENRTAETNARLDQTTVSRVVTRSITELKDVKERMITTPQGFYRVVKYLPKSAVKRMFELRRSRILELIAIAERELQESLHLSSALKNLYRALLLGRLYPDTLGFSMRLDEGSALHFKNLEMGIRNIFERLFRGLTFKPERAIDDEAIVWEYKVTLDNRPVAALHYEYYDAMGQTEADVKDGKTRMTFFYSKEESREREVILAIEYRYADEMDELTRAADSLMQAAALPNKISIILPVADRAKPTISLPLELRLVLDVGNSFEAVRSRLDSLVRKSRIVLGSAGEFESLEGLYGLILGPEGVIGLVQYKGKRTLDAATGVEVDMRKFGGKKITWIEVLK